MNAEAQVFVAIRCLVYNHEAYLRSCLDGFVMQKTNFKFVAVVHDDCSTDGSTEILMEYSSKYPEIIKPIFEKENQYSKPGNPLRKIMDEAISATGAKYIAMCEGDDYWTDPLKLQKQVDYMESHDECVMCCTRTKWLEDGVFTDGFGYQSETNTEIQTRKIIRHDGLINTASVLYRKGIVSRNDFSWWKIADVGDYPLFIALSLKGKVWFINDITTVYRYNHYGSWTEKCKPKLKHVRDTVNWMILLDEETQNTYKNDIYHYIFKLIRKLYLVQETQTKEYISAWLYSGRQIGIIRLLKDILIHYFPILKK